MKKKFSKLEESMEAFMKSQIAFMQNQGQTLNNHSQAISRLEIQMSQLASSLSKRPKGTLPSQPLVNLKTSNQAYEIQDLSINQCNVVHTLRSGKKVDKQVYQQKSLGHPDPTPASTSVVPPKLLLKHLTRTKLLNKFISL